MPRKKKPALPNTCQQWRRKLVTYGTLDTIRGGVLIGEMRWVTEKCGTPLFSDAARERGICSSCAEGWTHEHNFATTAPDGS